MVIHSPSCNFFLVWCYKRQRGSVSEAKTSEDGNGEWFWKWKQYQSDNQGRERDKKAREQKARDAAITGATRKFMGGLDVHDAVQEEAQKMGAWLIGHWPHLTRPILPLPIPPEQAIKTPQAGGGLRCRRVCTGA